MELSLHTIKPAKGSRRGKKRLGRGNASGTGTYAGRGLKGQRARSGGKGGLKRKGVKAFLQNKPKLRGFTSHKPPMESVNVGTLNTYFTDGDMVNGKKLIAKGLIRTDSKGIKILGTGELTKKLTIVADAYSETAQEKITKAGGSAEFRQKQRKTTKKSSAKKA